MVNVLDFGAVGDGTTDDTTALQAAIASLGATGGTVYFPVGDYKTTAALTVGSFVELLGESQASRILADTTDAAIKVANALTYNEYITVRRLQIRGGNTTPIGIDARYMSLSMIDNCEVTQFDQCCISYGGNTTEGVNASWSNTVKDSVIRNSPACIRLDGSHSTGGSPANWITIERCLVAPRDTSNSIGIDLVNGGQVRLTNNDISYAPNATGIMLRQHQLAEFEGNRFEDIGQVGPSHPIEKEFAYATFEFRGATTAEIYYQKAEYLTFTGNPTGGTFTLTRGAATTSPIAFSTTAATLAANIQTALATLVGIGVGNVAVTPVSTSSFAEMRVAWLNGRGRSNRPNLTANGSGLTGGTTPGITVTQGSHADALRYSDDISLGSVITDPAMPSLVAQERYLDIGIATVMRRPLVSVLPPGGDGVQMQRDTEPYPRMMLMNNGHIRWTDPDTGDFIAGLSILSFDPSQPKVAWDDNMVIPVSRHTTVLGEGGGGSDYYRGAFFRHEAGAGGRDQLRFALKDKDDLYYVRHVYPGFTVSQTLDFPSIAAGAVAVMTVTATGARAGDGVVLLPPTSLPAGLIAMGFVSAANTVSIRLFNGSGAAVNPPSAAWSVMVLQP